jgi:hypothetical protein
MSSNLDLHAHLLHADHVQEGCTCLVIVEGTSGIASAPDDSLRARNKP